MQDEKSSLPFLLGKNVKKDLYYSVSKIAFIVLNPSTCMGGKGQRTMDSATTLLSNKWSVLSPVIWLVGSNVDGAFEPGVTYMQQPISTHMGKCAHIVLGNYVL